MKTKTLRSNRTRPMPGPLASALQTHRKSQSDERTRVADLWQDSDHVFTTAIGTPIHPRNDYRSFQRIIKTITRTGSSRSRGKDGGPGPSTQDTGVW